MRFGRKCKQGFLPVYSVADEEEARQLLVMSCPRNYQNEFVAVELVAIQDLEHLQAFSDRLHKNHERLKENGLCRCHAAPAPRTKSLALRRRARLP